MRIDTSAGMVAAELAQWFIIITAASTLNAHGITDIRSSAEAARAIEPLVQTFPNSGALARTIFALGIVGLGLIGVPVLAGSTAYAVSDAFGLKQGLTRKFSEAKAFYGVIALSTLAGLAIQFLSVNPFQALVFAAVLNGLAAVPLLWVLAQVNGRKDILGERRGGPLSRFTVWLTFAVMALAAVALIATLF
jgi:Mn2+/Fe2+ NRAMP family transporter